MPGEPKRIQPSRAGLRCGLLEHGDVRPALVLERAGQAPAGAGEELFQLRGGDEEVVEPGRRQLAVANADSQVARKATAPAVSLVVGEVLGVVRAHGVGRLAEDARSLARDVMEA